MHPKAPLSLEIKTSLITAVALSLSILENSQNSFYNFLIAGFSVF